MFTQQGALHVLSQTAITTPVVRHCTAAVRNDQSQRREVLEQITLDELHKGRGVGIDVVRTGSMEVVIARGAHVHHGRHVQFDQLFVNGVPILIGQRRRGPMTTRRVGVEVGTDKAHVGTALQFAHAAGQRRAWRLRQLADTHEVLRVQAHATLDQVVANLRPLQTGGLGADVVRHGRRARRKDGQV